MSSAHSYRLSDHSASSDAAINPMLSATYQFDPVAQYEEPEVVVAAQDDIDYSDQPDGVVSISPDTSMSFPLPPPPSVVVAIRENDMLRVNADRDRDRNMGPSHDVGHDEKGSTLYSIFTGGYRYDMVFHICSAMCFLHIFCCYFSASISRFVLSFAEFRESI